MKTKAEELLEATAAYLIRWQFERDSFSPRRAFEFALIDNYVSVRVSCGEVSSVEGFAPLTPPTESEWLSTVAYAAGLVVGQAWQRLKREREEA